MKMESKLKGKSLASFRLNGRGEYLSAIDYALTCRTELTPCGSEKYSSEFQVMGGFLYNTLCSTA